MRRVLTASGAASLVLLLCPTAAFAIRPFSSDINAGRKSIGLVSDYEAPGSSKTTTTTTTGPAGSTGSAGSGGGGVASAGGGASGDAAVKDASSSAKPSPPALRDVLDIADRRGNCSAGVPLVVCQPETPEPEGQEQGPRQVTTTVTREEVFEKAVDKIQLTPPTIGASPCLAAADGCMGTVGVPVWLWVEDGGELPSESAQASAGPFSVRAEATVSRVEWSLGDGQSTICTNAGTVFDPDVHGWSAPDCGFETGWEKAGTYTMTATYLWDISWSGDVNGSTTREMSSSQDVTVREIQAVVDSHSA